jgi:hypothetical protein
MILALWLMLAVPSYTESQPDLRPYHNLQLALNRIENKIGETIGMGDLNFALWLLDNLNKELPEEYVSELKTDSRRLFLAAIRFNGRQWILSAKDFRAYALRSFQFYPLNEHAHAQAYHNLKRATERSQ